MTYSLLNSFSDANDSGFLEGLGGELIAQCKSNHSSNKLQNSYRHGLESDIASNGLGEGAGDTLRKLLIVLSNIGYCKEELSCDLYGKYKHIWLRYWTCITVATLSYWILLILSGVVDDLTLIANLT
jgi:exocyst complex component 2